MREQSECAGAAPACHTFSDSQSSQVQHGVTSGVVCPSTRGQNGEKKENNESSQGRQTMWHEVTVLSPTVKEQEVRDTGTNARGQCEIRNPHKTPGVGR